MFAYRIKLTQTCEFWENKNIQLSLHTSLLLYTHEQSIVIDLHFKIDRSDTQHFPTFMACLVGLRIFEEYSSMQ